MSSKNIRSDNSAFVPFERKKSVGVSVELPAVDQPHDQQKITDSINAARKNRKMMFSNIRKLFKENVSRVMPCLKENEYRK